MSHLEIPRKANRVLHLVMLIFLLMAIRIWYLCVFEHEHHQELAKKPQKRTVFEKANRGTIRDRFNIPLAINHLRYDACVCYDDLRQIPGVKWVKTAHGKIKTYPRREYISTLCQMLGDKLSLEPQKIEDIIYSQAALFPNTPFVIKEGLPEKIYYELKALERQYQGLKTLKSTERFYPQGLVAGDLVGYMGAIDSHQFFSLAHRIQMLKDIVEKHEEGELVFLPKGFSSIQEIKDELLTLEKKAYHIRDFVGKVGIEAQFDSELKGFMGKNQFEVDTKGHHIRKLSGSKPPIPGKRLLLNISSELQEYAEALLAENEKIREERFPKAGKDHDWISPPFIKGGSIVAIVPTTGEVVAMASYPRINPNDFISSKDPTKQQEIKKWLENPRWIADIWDGKTTLSKELYSFKTAGFFIEHKKLTIENYINSTLSLKGATRRAFLYIRTLNQACSFAKTLHTLLDLSEQPFMSSLIDTLYTIKEHHKASSFGTSSEQISLIEHAFEQHKDHIKSLKDKLDPIFKDVIYNDDKLLLLDLVELFANPQAFDEELLNEFGDDTLSTYRKISQSYSIFISTLKLLSQKIFHTHEFQSWRLANFKSYLADMRSLEKEKKTYQRPYTDYLDKKERQLFEAFWQDHHLSLMQGIFDEKLRNTHLSDHHLHALKASLDHELKNPSAATLLYSAYQQLQAKIESTTPEMFAKLLTTIKSFYDLQGKLHGNYPKLNGKKGSQSQQDLASAFYPKGGFGHGRSYAYRQTTPLGSIFKIVTAYEALKQQYDLEPHHPHDYLQLNPLTIIDDIQPSSKKEAQVLGFHEDGKKILRKYKGGTLPRTSHLGIGKIGLMQALERSSNIYFSLLASDVLQDPNDLVLTSLKFGFGHKTGIDLPGEISGSLPKDLHENRSGLYAFAIGQHSLIVTPLQAALMLSSLVNGGEILKPQVLNLSIGMQPESEQSLLTDDVYPFKDYLNRVGIFFPFFIEAHPSQTKPLLHISQKHLYRQLSLPLQIKEYLLESLHQIVSSARGSARANFIRYLYGNTAAMKNYVKLKSNMIGKTATAELFFRPTLDRECPTITCKDIWFGGISFKVKEESHPLSKQSFEEPELVVVVYLRFGDFGKEAAPLAGQIITKWRELLKKYENF